MTWTELCEVVRKTAEGSRNHYCLELSYAAYPHLDRTVATEVKIKLWDGRKNEWGYDFKSFDQVAEYLERREPVVEVESGELVAHLCE